MRIASRSEACNKTTFGDTKYIFWKKRTYVTMTEGETTTIRVYVADQKRISAYGLFGESFAEVMKRILDEYEEFKARESEK